MPLAQFDPNAVVIANAGVVTSCMPAAEVVRVLNDYGRSDPERVYRELDALTNVEGALYLSARMRPTPDGPQSYQVQNTKAIWWVQTGAINGPVIELHRSNGKSVYLATQDSTVSLTYAHAGVVLCTPLNPAADITWWGN
ncbi:MAG: hypothetical protein NUV65_00195 [Candidatus Roizmanbacteria bacterium]|nr:hypothetical protein [Candidatus Roizmanbacteria bacterium]